MRYMFSPKYTLGQWVSMLMRENVKTQLPAIEQFFPNVTFHAAARAGP